jgi:hypothetical protein
MAVLPRATRRSRIAHFKAPFIVAVLAPVAALDSGCGQAEPGAGPFDRLPGSTNALGCPGAPLLGSVCRYEGLSCSYGDPSDTGSDCPEPARRCVDGIWQLDAIACDPPPQPIATCPDTLPQSGTSCWGYELGLACEYPSCFGASIAEARCSAESLRWETHESSCNPPPDYEACPSDPPELGSRCRNGGQQCVYGTCGDLDDPRSTPLCQDGFWVQLEVALCPTPEADAGANAVDGGAADAGVADGG